MVLDRWIHAIRKGGLEWEWAFESYDLLKMDSRFGEGRDRK